VHDNGGPTWSIFRLLTQLSKVFKKVFTAGEIVKQGDCATSTSFSEAVSLQHGATETAGGSDQLTITTQNRE